MAGEHLFPSRPRVLSRMKCPLISENVFPSILFKGMDIYDIYFQGDTDYHYSSSLLRLGYFDLDFHANDYFSSQVYFFDICSTFE